MPHLQCVQRISEREQIIAEYESSRAIPNPQILTKLERALGKRVCSVMCVCVVFAYKCLLGRFPSSCSRSHAGVKLRGKDIGSPLGGPK